MKIRSGFVSNSSSSSFVCLGIRISDKPELKAKFVDEENYILNETGIKILPDKTGYFPYDCQEILGWSLADGSTDDGSFDVEEATMEELKEYADALEKVTGIKPVLMGGTYAC